MPCHFSQLCLEALVGVILDILDYPHDLNAVVAVANHRSFLFKQEDLVLAAGHACPGGWGINRNQRINPMQSNWYAPQPAMRRADEEQEAVPITRDAKRTLPDARRSIARRAGGQQQRS